MRITHQTYSTRVACLVSLLAVFTPSVLLAAPRRTTSRTRAYAREDARGILAEYVIVVPFANEGGAEDDDWIGMALQQVLQFKLSHVPGLHVLQYEQYRPMPIREYTIPVQSESIEARAERLRQSLGRWTLILGTFLPAGDELEIRIYAATRSSGALQQVRTLRGRLEEMGTLLDEGMSALLRAVLPLGAIGGTEWRGKAPTRSAEALQWFARGVLAAQEDSDQAGLCYLSAVQLDPTFLAAHWAVVPFCRTQRDTEGALEHVNVVAAAMPNDVQVRMARAAALSGVGDFMEAAKEYQLCAKLNPRLQKSLNQHIVRCYSRANQLDKALTWAKGLLRSAPNDASALTVVGGVYQARGEHKEAVGYFQRAIRQEAASWRAYWELGQCYAQLGRLDDAAQQYRAGLAQQPKALSLVRALADVYEQQGKTNEAVREWERLLEISPPGSALAREAEQRLAALKPGK